MVKRNDAEQSTPAPLEERSKALFDESVGNLDGRTRSALTQARHAALAELEGSHRSALRVMGPLSGIAAATFVLIVMFAPLRLTRESAEVVMTPFEDLDIVAESENIELMENLDFYVWLDSANALPNDG
jgi:hypothetical protein